MKTGKLLVLLILFFVCGMNAQNGPWSSPLLLRTSSNGTTFGTSQTFQDSAGVPNIIMLSDGRIISAFQWFPSPMHGDNWDSIAVKFSYDTAASWTSPFHCNFSGMPMNFKRPFDPALADAGGGQIRMYFSSGPAFSMQLDSTVDTYSAISSDGINYTFEGLARYDDLHLAVIDPTVTFFNGNWQYLAPRGAPQDGSFHASSSDGLTFTTLTTIPSDNAHQWTGNLMNDGSTMRFYGAGNNPIWWSSSSDGNTWSSYTNTNVQGGDPAVLKLPNGTYLMIYVGPPYATGTNEIAKTNSIHIFPNPSEGPLTILLNENGNYEVSVFNLQGEKVYAENFSGYSTQLNLETLSKGMYFVEVFNPEQNRMFGEMIVR